MANGLFMKRQEAHQEFIGDTPDAIAELLESKRMRIAVSASHCMEWQDIRPLLQQGIEQISIADSRVAILEAREFITTVKLLAETMKLLQEQQRIAYRLDMEPIPQTKAELQQINRILIEVSNGKRAQVETVSYEDITAVS